MPPLLARALHRCSWAAGAAALAFAWMPAQALELRVLSAGAVEPGMRPALAAFERTSGHTVRLSFAAAPELRAALRNAPLAEVIVVPEAALAEPALAPVPADASAPVGRVGVGVAVRALADTPDITSAEALKTALASADSVVFNRASTGSYIETMLKALGVAEATGAKATRVADGASVMRRLLSGTGRRELGFAAMTEIVLFADQGIRLVGPLPTALQNYTAYVAVPWADTAAPGDAARREAVAALMRHLQGSEARALFAGAGIEPTH